MKYYHLGAIFLASSLFFSYPLNSQAQSNPTPPANTPTTAINRPDLNMGSRGEFVQELQAALKLLGFYDSVVDGIYGENTAIAVTRFQQNALLNTTGLVNQQTWNRLFPMGSTTSTPPTVTVATSPPTVTNPSNNTPPANTNPTNNTPPANTNPSNNTPPANTNPSNNTPPANTNPSNNTPPANTIRAENLPLLKEGMEGAEVKLLQEKLKALGFFNGVIDGIFGRNTLQAVIAAQIYFHLDGDGIVGLQTWKKILGQ